MSAAATTACRSLAGRQAVAARMPARARAGRLVVRAATALPADVKTVAPVGERLFVKIEEPEQQTIGGILLPSSATRKPTSGEVVNAGTAKSVKRGDKVVYSKYAGTELQLQGGDYVLLKEDDVIGLLAGDDIAALQPLQDRVLIEVEVAADQTAGGVLLTDGAKDKPTMGRVVAVGSGREGEDGKQVVPAVTVGSTVLYQRYSGTEFEGQGNKQYIVVRDADILATVS